MCQCLDTDKTAAYYLWASLFLWFLNANLNVQYETCVHVLNIYTYIYIFYVESEIFLVEKRGNRNV